LKVKHFAAATNANDTVPQYLQSGVYTPKPSVQTISNAMDVGDPSNFERLDMIFGHNCKNFGTTISSYSFTDDATRAKMKETYQQHGYILDPHGAVGMLGIEKQLAGDHDTPGIFLETAHPCKFLDVVQEATGITPPLPETLKSCLNKQKESIKIDNDYKQLEKILADRYL
jgi:threonine synthase